MVLETRQEPLAADAATIRADLLHMTRHWHELPERGMVEIRALGEDKSPQSGKFAVDWIDEAVEFAINMNKIGRNIYAVRNPIRQTKSGSASDADIIAARFLWADCDDPAASANVLKFTGPKWTASVVTGTIPYPRAHTYWELDAWCYDLAAWRAQQAAIAAHFGSDSTVINPSRIMRLAGTVSHPAAHKRAKGYVSELSVLRTEYEPARGPVTLDQMQRVFGAAPSENNIKKIDNAPGSFQIDTGGSISLDRDQMTIQAMSGMEWHNAVIRLVASYVARGLADGEIHALTQPLTLPGYTGQQTAAEVQTAINGARAKGWTPEPPAFAPNFDHAPAPTASDPAPEVLPWRVQRADEFTADFVAPEYIVDGIIQRGRIYTLTAPTGSGKTAVMLYAATAIAMGEKFCDRDVEAGDVLFLAGENPDDVRARVIGTMEFYKINPADCRVHFIAGTFSIRADLDRLRVEAAKLPNLIMIVVDTFAAYFDGDDENSNAQALDFARVIRKIAAFDAKPAVIMPAHPVKNATRGNLSPKGGSSLLNEVDGNLTLWNDGGLLSLHWQGKFRGPEFDPLTFELIRHESSLLCDNQGRLMPTVLAKPVLQMRATEIATANLSIENKLLLSIRRDPGISASQRGADVGLNHHQKVARALAKLEQKKLIRRLHTNWELTKDGERVVEMIENGGKFAAEITP